jgi:hypothetical protein
MLPTVFITPLCNAVSTRTRFMARSAPSDGTRRAGVVAARTLRLINRCAVFCPGTRCTQQGNQQTDVSDWSHARTFGGSPPRNRIRVSRRAIFCGNTEQREPCRDLHQGPHESICLSRLHERGYSRRPRAAPDIRDTAQGGAPRSTWVSSGPAFRPTSGARRP